MPSPSFDDIQRSILEFLARCHPYETQEVQFETRITVCGELRLALHEYDQACGELYRQRLIVTDPPYAHDCDAIALTAAGRRAVAISLRPGGLAARILIFLEASAAAGETGPFDEAAVRQAVGLGEDEAGQRAYRAACQALFDHGKIQSYAQGDSPGDPFYASIVLPLAHRE